MKLQKNGVSFQVILPKQIVLAKQWSVGDELEFRLNENGELILKKNAKSTN